MNRINFTIIIPHKDSSLLLFRCIDSIPDREDIQIIIVDDNSEENHLRCLEKIERSNLEIEFAKDNKGAGRARNIGLSKAVGKWVLFADADDFYNVDAFNCFYKYLNSDYDVVFYYVNTINLENGLSGKRKLPADTVVRNYKEESLRSKDLLRFRNCVVWNKMVKKNFIDTNKIFFEECLVNNDVLYTLMIGLHLNNFHIEKNELYCCTYSSKSMSFVKRDNYRELEYFKMSLKRNGFYRAINKPYLSRPLYLYVLYIFYRRGFFSALTYFKYCFKHREDIEKCKQEYTSVISENITNNK